jgi:conjugal transfer pilus assembly protein TraI
VIENLMHRVLERTSFSGESRDLADRVFARLRDLVGDMPASADHHHSESNGLLQHSLEVAVKMLDEFEKVKTTEDSAQWQYVAFLAGLGHDLGKLFDMDIQAGDQRWSPLHETHAEFLQHIKVEPVLRWDKGRLRGGHAQLSPWLMHHLLSPDDIRFIGLERLPQLTAALTGTHARDLDRSTPLARLVSKLDQESVEQAAPDWMNKRPDSKVNQFVRALRNLISDGGLSVNTPGAPVYVMGDKAAVVVPLSIGAVRHYLKQEAKSKLPSNHRLYDLLAQAELVEADENGQCVKRIRVPGKRSPVELSALIFNQGTIIPQQILPTLPKVTFEIVREKTKQAVAIASSIPFPVGSDDQSSAGLNKVTREALGVSLD